MTKDYSYIDRMKEEFNELDNRINKLKSFKTEHRNDGILNPTQYHLLSAQLDAMETYHSVLETRIVYEIGRNKEEYSLWNKNKGVKDDDWDLK